jgi:hypothetical protein
MVSPLLDMMSQTFMDYTDIIEEDNLLPLIAIPPFIKWFIE